MQNTWHIDMSSMNDKTASESAENSLCRPSAWRAVKCQKYKPLNTSQLTLTITACSALSHKDKRTTYNVQE